MTRTKLAAVSALFLTLAAACGEGQGSLTRVVDDAIDETRAESRTFHYTDVTLDGKKEIVVEGKVQDDLRYSAIVAMNGKRLYQLVVSDDSLAVRALDKSVRDRAAAAAKTDEITARALSEGRWVVDHTVAPPLLAAAAAVDEEEATADRPTSSAEQNLVGDDPAIDGAQMLNYTGRAIRSGFGVERFNPEAVDYNSLDDPWSEDGERDLDQEGLVRYDLILPPLPGRAERGRTQARPRIEHFRKMAVYTEGDKVVEIRERISLSERREFRRAETGRTAKYYLELRDAAKAGAVEGELREREMRYRVTKMGDVEVALPRDAVEGILGNVLPVVKEIFDFEFIGGDAPVGIPGGGPLPAGSPRPDGSPAPAGSPLPGATRAPAAEASPGPTS